MGKWPMGLCYREIRGRGAGREECFNALEHPHPTPSHNQGIFLYFISEV